MPTPDDDGVPSPFTAQSIYPVEPGATNPELAKEFLARHRADMEARQPDIDQILGKMQLSTDSMSKILDDTTASIKASRAAQTNLPLMAMAAGMLSNRGNFGNQLGAGFSAVIPTVQKDREQDEQMQMQLAQLALRKSAIEQGPLEAKLAYMRALQTGDINAARAIEQALIRAQGQGQNSPNNPKLIQKTVQDAWSEARKQVDSQDKEMYATAEEREAEVNRRFLENIKVAKASGIQIPDDVITQITGGKGATLPKTASPRKSFFDAPTDPETQKQTLEKGLPAPPSPYIYQSVGPKERPAIMQKETDAYRKDTKDMDDQSAQQRTQLDQIDQIEKILDKPHANKIVGQQVGNTIKNTWLPNWSEDVQTLTGLFNYIQLHSIPKGQGAVSNMERELFAQASPNMNFGVAANKNLLAIQKEIIKRDKDRREFFNDYFNTYRTADGMVQAWDRYIQSPAGSAFIRNQDGSPVANTKRVPWRDYFRGERQPQPDAGNRAKGGYIKLGAEYD